jgi:hypothetical protein
MCSTSFACDIVSSWKLMDRFMIPRRMRLATLG